MNEGSSSSNYKPCPYPIQAQFSCCQDTRILELNPAPVTNIIVQQFDVCSHDMSGSYRPINHVQPANHEYVHVQPANFNYVPNPYESCFQTNSTCIQPSTVSLQSEPHFFISENQASRPTFTDSMPIVFGSSQSVFPDSKETNLLNLHQSCHKLDYENKDSFLSQDAKLWFKNTSDFLSPKSSTDQYSTNKDLFFSNYSKDDLCKIKGIDNQTLQSNSIGLSGSVGNKRLRSPYSDSQKLYTSTRPRTKPKTTLCRIGKSRSPNYRERNHSFYMNSQISDKTSASKSSLRPDTPEFKKSFNTSDNQRKTHGLSERENLLAKWRKDSRGGNVLEKIAALNPEEDFKKEKLTWTRTSPGDLYYEADQSNCRIVCGTEKLVDLCKEFEEQLIKKAEIIRSELPKYEPLSRKKKVPIKKHSGCHSCSSSNSSSDSESELDDCINEELEHKKNHPLRLHQELWFNDSGEMNDGPLCRCSARAKRSGIRHNIYAGENRLGLCDLNSNNADKLFHYRITISPPTNFLVKTPTIIEYDAHEYIFEGFSMFSHKKLDDLPLCKVIRFNIEYTIVYFEEKFPDNFTIRELNSFSDYLFKEILELVDLDLRAFGDSTGCPQYHFMPRFVRELPGNGKEILSMNEVMRYLLDSYQPLVSKEDLPDLLSKPQNEWQVFTESVKGMVVTCPGKKPCSLRVDQLDRDQGNAEEPQFPEIVHFGIRPPQLSYAGNPEYQKAWREYVKFRHLLANMPKPSFEDKRKLEVKEIRLQNMRTRNELKRNVTVTVSSENFFRTGIMCDVVQHAMLIPVLVTHLRFHRSLDVLEENIGYTFSNRYFLQLALTHPSYRENFGTNPDHARNSLTNCGIRQPVYGDRRIHYMNTRKRGINTLINIMSRFGKSEETDSNITHNERLEFLGDAVVEFVTSVHLFHMFPDLEEGGLATYRAAIVQNQHLAVLAKTLGLEAFMLYAHGSDLCHDLELRHAMANCFEALMGALFLDGGISVADKVFGKALFQGDDLLHEWVNYPPHPLQEQEPLGDRKWISCFEFLKKLTKFEESVGVEFTHIRLLARAFTDRSIGFTNLTLGSNQRLEFLGDTVLQLIASEYLYKFFPEHHEGHLSLLRSSLVNNRTQAVVCNDLGMTAYALYSNPKAELKTKDRADLLEAFLGALYVDQGLEFCQTFCSVCFFPRLQDFIMHQDWNDPKSKLQQCCLTLRTMEGGEPEIPVYKVIECMGPTNTRTYTVAVYFKGIRLAKASGHSIQQAEMNAAKSALNNSKDLFPQLDHQKRVISKSMNRQRRGRNSRNCPQSNKKSSSADGNNSKIGKDVKGYARVSCRTPPLAYQSRNRSESPKESEKDTTKSDQNSSKNEDHTKSNHKHQLNKSASDDEVSTNNSTNNLSDKVNSTDFINRHQRSGQSGNSSQIKKSNDVKSHKASCRTPSLPLHLKLCEDKINNICNNPLSDKQNNMQASSQKVKPGDIKFQNESSQNLKLHSTESNNLFSLKEYSKEHEASPLSRERAVPKNNCKSSSYSRSTRESSLERKSINGSKSVETHRTNKMNERKFRSRSKSIENQRQDKNFVRKSKSRSKSIENCRQNTSFEKISRSLLKKDSSAHSHRRSKDPSPDKFHTKNTSFKGRKHSRSTSLEKNSNQKKEVTECDSSNLTRHYSSRKMSLSTSPSRFSSRKRSLSTSPSRFSSRKMSPTTSPSRFSSRKRSLSTSPPRLSSRKRSLSRSPKRQTSSKISISRSPMEYTSRKRSPNRYTSKERSISRSPLRHYSRKKSPSKSPPRLTSRKRNLSRSPSRQMSRNRSISRSPLKRISKSRSTSRSPQRYTSKKRSPYKYSYRKKSTSRSPDRYISRNRRSLSRSPSSVKFNSNLLQEKRQISRSREEARKELMDYMLGISKCNDDKSGVPYVGPKLGLSQYSNYNQSNSQHYQHTSNNLHPSQCSYMVPLNQPSTSGTGAMPSVLPVQNNEHSSAFNCFNAFPPVLPRHFQNSELHIPPPQASHPQNTLPGNSSQYQNWNDPTYHSKHSSYGFQ